MHLYVCVQHVIANAYIYNSSKISCSKTSPKCTCKFMILILNKFKIYPDRIVLKNYFTQMNILQSLLCQSSNRNPFVIIVFKLSIDSRCYITIDAIHKTACLQTQLQGGGLVKPLQLPTN